MSHNNSNIFAINSARAHHWSDLGEQARKIHFYHTLRANPEEPQQAEAGGMATTIRLPVAMYTDPLVAEGLLSHLRAEFPELPWPATWEELDNVEVPSKLLKMLQLVAARRTFKGTCSICQGWQVTLHQPTPAKGAVAAYLKSKEINGASPHTLKLYRSVLTRFTENYEWLPTESQAVQEFLAKFSPGNTRRNYFKVLRYFFKFVTSYFGAANPTNSVETPRVKRKLPQSLSRDEMATLVSQASLSKRDKTALMLFLGTGVREGEAVNLKFKDINNGALRVSGKTGERLIPLIGEVTAALLSLQDGRGDDDAVFWGSHPTQPLGTAGFYALVRRAFSAAGIKGKRASPHTLRHTFARNWITNGGDTVSLMHILGHTSLEMTQKYVRLSDSDLAAKNLRFNPLSNIPLADRGISPADDRITYPDDRIPPIDGDLTQW